MTTYVLVFNPDGSFRADNVSAGSYTLNIAPTQPGEENWREKAMGSLTKKIIVPAVGGGQSDKPFDLGTLELVITLPLKVGQPAPSIEVKTLDGQPLKLADYHGKFVLLHFWATTIPQAVTEVAELKTIYDAFAKDDRFVMLSLSFDEQTSAVERFVKQHELRWRQGVLGQAPPPGGPFPWGVNSIPMTFLIDPDGKVLAREPRASSIRAEVEKALQKKSANVP